MCAFKNNLIILCENLTNNILILECKDQPFKKFVLIDILCEVYMVQMHLKIINNLCANIQYVISFSFNKTTITVMCRKYQHILLVILIQERNILKNKLNSFLQKRS